MARVKIAGTSGASENTIVFSSAGGHSHNGRNSSLIDSTAYSMYDFSPTFVGTEVNPDRAVRQENNRIAFEDVIKRVVNNSVLAPAGIRLEPGSLNGSLIIANTITANQLAANTITASEISAGSITADLLSSNIVLINNVISSNNYNANAKTGWTILSNGYSEFRSGIISNWNFNNTSITSTVVDANNFTHSISLATSGVNLNTDVYNWSNTPVISMISTASNNSPNGSTYHTPGSSFYFATANTNMNGATYIRPYAIHLRDGILNDTDSLYYGGYIDEGMVTMSLQSFTFDGGGIVRSTSIGSGGGGGGGGGSVSTTTYDTDKALRLALIKKTGSDWTGNNAPIQNYLNLTKTYTHIGKKIVSPGGALMGTMEFIAGSVPTTTYSSTVDYLLVHKDDNTVKKVLASTLAVSSASSAGSVPASGISGQTGMWTSAQRPGPYRLYRRDDNSDYSVQTYWTGARWRLYGYQGDTGHADTHVGYADSAASAADSSLLNGYASSTAGTANYVQRTDPSGILCAIYHGAGQGANYWNASDYSTATAIMRVRAYPQSNYGDSLGGPGVYSTKVSDRAVYTNSTNTLGTVASTIKSKENIRPYLNNNKAILGIRPIIFDYKEEYVEEECRNDRFNKFGLIAEDLHDAGLTHLVYYNDNDEIDGLAYEKIGVELLSVVIDQQTKIDDLEARLQALEAV
jgi:hypothetical protein